MSRLRKALIVVSAVLATGGLGACNALQRLSEVGEPPKMTAIENPVQQRDYRPVTMPMPAPQIAEPSANSLWRPGSRAFFKDQRAGQVGDILTVIVDITDEAELSNETSRTRGASESAGIPALAGVQDTIRRALPNTDTINMNNLIGVDSDSSHAGAGTIQREETINIRLAAVVLQVLPNGNLVIAGRQEVRVNSELRELQVTGVIRPQDINSTNTIEWDKIAEARISYGGRGTISDVQQPRYGQQIFDIIYPF